VPVSELTGRSRRYQVSEPRAVVVYFMQATDSAAGTIHDLGAVAAGDETSRLPAWLPIIKP
jgi:hypothetical protein